MNDIDEMTDREIFLHSLPWMFLMSAVGVIGLVILYYIVCAGVHVARWLGGGLIG